MHRWPSPKATKRLRDRVREITDKRASVTLEEAAFLQRIAWQTVQDYSAGRHRAAAEVDSGNGGICAHSFAT
jgi:hypothetical protein